MSRLHAALGGLLGAILVGLLLTTPGTLAVFTDEANVTTRADAFTSGVVAAPTNGRCVDPNGRSAIVEWRNVDVGYRYFVEVVSASGSVIGTTTVPNNGAAGTTQTLEITPGQYGTKSGPYGAYGREDYTVRVYSEVGSEWRSSSIPVPIFYDRYLFLGSYIQCG